MAALAPVVDEVGDEVDARLVGDDEAFLQTTTHAQAIRTKLVENRARFRVETHVDLVEIFHVVHVHSHHVTESVRQEKRVSTGSHGLLGVATHQSEFLQTVGHQATDGEMAVHILHAGLGDAQNEVVTRLDNAVDFKLPLRILAVHGHRARVVGTVVRHGFGTAVAKHEPTVFKLVHRRISVHNFAVLRENRRETHLCAVGIGDADELSGDVFLGHACANQPHCRRVHLIADFRRFFQFHDFLGGLGRAHFHDGLNQRHRSLGFLLGRMDAEQVHQLNLDVVAVRRQEMDDLTI